MKSLYVVVLAGGIASGKSTVARELEALGAYRVDLDDLSREVVLAGSPLLADVARAFGADVLDEGTGTLRRDVLAQRAFSSAEQTALLESLVHPAIRDLLARRLEEHAHEGLCVVEVPLLDRVEYLIDQADEVACVVCPVSLRRARAIARGMRAEDFDARVARQPSDDYLISHANTVFSNETDEDALRQQVAAWWNKRLGNR